MRIVLLGPPGAGKGTQAETLVREFSLEHLATGDLFRAAYRERDPLGIQAHEAIARGELVDDEIVLRLVEKKLNSLPPEKGVLFDGFPRTRDQAVALDEILEKRNENLDCVVLIAVDAEILVDRLKERRLCRNCGKSYHLRFKPPRVPGKCDICGGELYQREDDKPETIRKRFEVYERDTAPLIDYYENQGVLLRVDGSQEMEKVGTDILEAVGGILHRGS